MDGGHGWVHVVDPPIFDRVSRTVSMTVVDTNGGLSGHRSGDDDDGDGRGIYDGPPNSWSGGPGG